MYSLGAKFTVVVFGCIRLRLWAAHRRVPEGITRLVSVALNVNRLYLLLFDATIGRVTKRVA
ncbi:MAG: hypothetical protein ABH865_02770 [Candidatus Omnitrophota bacterium]